jgi:hypothetical protein
MFDPPSTAVRLQQLTNHGGQDSKEDLNSLRLESKLS